MNTVDIGDHPAIARTLATGYPDGKVFRIPVCPVCEEETDTVYTNPDGDVVGCNNCLIPHDAWDYMGYD